MYAQGAEAADDTLDTWLQRLDVESEEDRDALKDGITDRVAAIDLTGIDQPTRDLLRRRIRFVNRGQDGRIRSVKGALTIGAPR